MDIAIRRLIVTKTDLLRLREWVQQKTTLRRAQGEVPAQTSPQMEALFSAKSRVRDNAPVTRVDSSAQEMPVETDSVSRPEKEARETPSKVEESTSTTSALLARKKNIRK
ncbi:MAG: hypothetical protein IPL71_10685 [Anaerolineales bacterium]|uniref:hypothetical protein n=1 Tax=Candidatus Villigracilis proximus TaxID=3140683 RepID=UPI0031372D59|nr:hypothetical protein [Anaerolineales bacterium]